VICLVSDGLCSIAASQKPARLVRIQQHEVAGAVRPPGWHVVPHPTQEFCYSALTDCMAVALCNEPGTPDGVKSGRLYVLTAEPSWS
jgi:hypothetical protein